MTTSNSHYSHEHRPSQQELVYERLRAVTAGDANVQMGALATYPDLWPPAAATETAATVNTDLPHQTGTASANFLITQTGQQQQADEARRQIAELELP